MEEKKEDMEKESEYSRLIKKFRSKGLRLGEQSDFWAILRDFRDAAILYHQSSKEELRELYAEEVAEAKANLDSYCKYYGLGQINYNELILEI